MRNRLLFAFGGAVVGLLLAGPLEAVSPVGQGLTTVVSMVSGLALGYVASTLVDVFTSQSEG